METTENQGKVIIFPYISQCNTEESPQLTQEITLHYIRQLIHMFERHGFDIEEEDFVNDMSVILMLLQATLDRNIGKNNRAISLLDKTALCLLDKLEEESE